MIDLTQLAQMIAAGESVEREFKFDRETINDATIYEGVVALAGTVGNGGSSSSWPRPTSCCAAGDLTASAGTPLEGE